MAALASIGDGIHPVHGHSAPAAKGIASAL
jgi:hypothetical protein